MSENDLLAKAKELSEELALEKYPVAFLPSGSAGLTYDANYPSRKFFIETFLDGVQFAINENEIERATCCLQNEEENQKLKKQLEVCRVALEKIHSETRSMYLTEKGLLQSKYDHAFKALAEIEAMK